MSFPRYPKYKPSGVEWLGDVPDDIVSGKALAAGVSHSATEEPAASAVPLTAETRP